MLFNSIEYALFLPAVFALFYLRQSTRWRQVLLLAGSYLFYGAWDWRFLGLIILSTSIDYLVARRLEGARPENRRALVMTSIGVNLGILAAFKYFGFFVESAQTLVEAAGIRVSMPLLIVALPVGISFYTFQSMAYTVDVYRGRVDPEHDPIVFALYVAFFPQLVAGPIERANRLLPQLRSLENPTHDDRSLGFQLILLGLFKKLAIADAVAPIVDAAFETPSEMSRSALLMGVVAFAIQIYGDFSGYTDIARGSARVLGVHLVHNFRQPYLSRSITEFWRRWHISLSEWLRDYLYIPLGGGRGSKWSTMRNLMITMLLGGLWHGAAWSFVIWGGIHGTLLSVERLAGVKDRLEMRHWAWMPATLAVVVIAWIPFRAGSLGATAGFAAALMEGSGSQTLSTASYLILGTAALFAAMLDISAESQPAVNPLAQAHASVRGLGYGMAAIAAIVFSAGTAQSFLYFQF